MKLVSCHSGVVYIGAILYLEIPDVRSSKPCWAFHFSAAMLFKDKSRISRRGSVDDDQWKPHVSSSAGLMASGLIEGIALIEANRLNQTPE